VAAPSQCLVWHLGRRAVGPRLLNLLGPKHSCGQLASVQRCRPAADPARHPQAWSRAQTWLHM